MIIETERMILREYTLQDFNALYEIMSDAETMQHYPNPFNQERTMKWIEWNLQNYKEYGFGLWAVVLRETDEFMGDCVLILQKYGGELNTVYFSFFPIAASEMLMGNPCLK